MPGHPGLSRCRLEKIIYPGWICMMHCENGRKPYFMKLISKEACCDIVQALYRFPLAGLLGWQDVKQRYKRSRIGPFWLTISMGIMIAAIGLIFGQLMGSSIGQFLPFLALGLIVWTLILTTVNEGCVGFIAAESIIKQLPIPLFTHVLRVVWRNLIIFSHNLVIFPLIMVFYGSSLDWMSLLSLAGLGLLIVNLMWIALFLAILSARYRDMPQMVASVFQVVFYLTPIIWLPEIMQGRVSNLILDLNPFNHFINLVREPLLTPDSINASSWIIAGVIAIVGWLFTLVFYSRYKNRIAFWL